MTSEVFNMDCMDGMKQYPDKYFDLAIVDPEYGRGEHGGKNRSSIVKQKNGTSSFVNGNKYERKNWDNKPAGADYFHELFRISKHQIICGCNYYHANFGPGRIVWDKVNDGADQSNCEIIFNSLTDRVDIFRFMWRGMMQGKSIIEGTVQQGNKKLNENRIHPTQKPIPLYKWILKKYAKPGDKIIDTHLGSGSSRIAAYDMGFDFTGFEIDKDYFIAQEKRFSQHISQLTIQL